MIKIKEIWFSDDQIIGRGEDGRIYSQSLLWYPRLRAASAEEREKYTFGFDGRPFYRHECHAPAELYQWIQKTIG